MLAALRKRASDEKRRSLDCLPDPAEQKNTGKEGLSVGQQAVFTHWPIIWLCHLMPEFDLPITAPSSAATSSALLQLATSRYNQISPAQTFQRPLPENATSSSRPWLRRRQSRPPPRPRPRGASSPSRPLSAASSTTSPCAQRPPMRSPRDAPLLPPMGRRYYLSSPARRALREGAQASIQPA